MSSFPGRSKSGNRSTKYRRVEVEFPIAEQLGRQGLPGDTANLREVRDAFRLCRKIPTFRVGKNKVEPHQASLDGLRLVIPAVAAVLVSHGRVEGPEVQVKHLPVVTRNEKGGPASRRTARQLRGELRRRISTHDGLEDLSGNLLHVPKRFGKSRLVA